MTPIPAAQQFKAIAYLRWRLFANGFRRKGGKGELAARILIFPVAFSMLFGVVAGSFAGGWAAAANHHLEYLTVLFWAIFALQIIVSINIAPPGLSFDPASLIRYPLTLPRYLGVRLFLGLLSASTVVGTCALLAAAAGISITYPRLFLLTFAAAIALAITNMLFTRMIFAWVDRWLSTRRAREFFTGFIILFSVGIQYANVTFNGIGRHQTGAQQQEKLAAVVRFYHSSAPVLKVLPPGLTALSIQRGAAGQIGFALLLIGVILLFAAAFLAVWSWRMQREYRGENLSEVSKQPALAPEARPGRNPEPHSSPALPAMSGSTSAGKPALLSPVLGALFTKELIYVRRNPAQYYSLFLPLAMVFLFAARMGRLGTSGLVFPAAAAYSILGVSALAYNVFGLDANGIQFYFLSPVPFHSVFLAKNLFHFAIPTAQMILLYLLLTFTVGAPGLVVTLSVLTWVAFATLINVTVGNMRSITAPKKIDPGKVSRRQASQLSAFIALGIMLAVIALGAVVLFGARAGSLPWLPIPIFLVLAGGAFLLYWTMLSRVDALARKHRETLIEELSKVE